MNVSDVINRTIKCSCGAEHRCDIEDLYIGEGALSHLSDVIKKYNNIMLISDKNTAFAAAAAKAVSIFVALSKQKTHLFPMKLRLPKHRVICRKMLILFWESVRE